MKQPKTPGLAWGALVCAVLGLCLCIPSLVAVGLAVAALVKYGKNPE